MRRWVPLISVVFAVLLHSGEAGVGEPSGGRSSAPPPSQSQSCTCSNAALHTPPEWTHGQVEECCCPVDVVSVVNPKILPVLFNLTRTSYFRYYKLNMWRKCKYFPEDGQCILRTCAVEECNPQEWHQHWTEFEQNDSPGAHLEAEPHVVESDEPNDDNTSTFSRLDSFIDFKAFDTWTECAGDAWSIDSPDEPESSMSYVDLSKNPERFTGYTGDKANRIWAAIYNENCFSKGDASTSSGAAADLCIEKRVFYRLISGLHTSITTHLLYDNLLDPEKSTWGPNPGEFYKRVGMFPQRVKNLYFTYMVALRAFSKIAPTLLSQTYPSPNALEPVQISEMLHYLDETIQLDCPSTFDETALFNGPDSDSLKKQFKSRFRNITGILDCVTCEKCRLWGKVQINGLATALKVLFEFEASADPKQQIAGAKQGEKASVKLQRTEVVALMNVLMRLSESVHMATELYDLYLAQSHQPPTAASTITQFGQGAAQSFAARIEALDAYAEKHTVTRWMAAGMKWWAHNVLLNVWIVGGLITLTICSWIVISWPLSPEQKRIQREAERNRRAERRRAARAQQPKRAPRNIAGAAR